MSYHLNRLWWGLLGLALGAVLASASFAIGFELGLLRGGAMADPDHASLLAQRDAVAGDLAALEEQLFRLRQEASILERSRQIERETNRALQEQLKAAQSERLALVKEGSYLKRLIREGGKGAVSVHDLVLVSGAEPRSYRYGFTVTQLIPDTGETLGQITLGVSGDQAGEARKLELRELPRAEPRELSMHFDHFQRFEGELTLPEDLAPQSVTVTVSPEGDRLTGTSESFPWIVAPP